MMTDSMPFKSDELIVNKIEMAKIQLDAAIAAYFEGRLVVSITLAGAAEEIFGSMLRRDHIQNSLEKIASLPPLLVISDNPQVRIDFLNNVRNNLKHASDKLEDKFVFAKLDAFIIIARALGNSELLKIDDSLAMKAFRSLYAQKV